MHAKVIAIDGPAASGKTTIGQMLAEKLGYLFLDTGCMYRAVTLAAVQKEINLLDEAAVTQLAFDVEIQVRSAAGYADGRLYTVLLNGEDVTWAIRSPEVDLNVSQVSKFAGVRRELVRQQRELARLGDVVMVGRDIGTVVLPDAPLKLYVVASAEARAKRRLADRQAQGMATADEFEAILADIIRRDKLDSSRKHSPLKAAADAILIDTSDRTPQEVLDQILQLQVD